MADNVEVIDQQQQAEQPTAEAQIAEQMNFRLNGGAPPQSEAAEQEQQAAVTEQQTPVEQPVFQFNSFTEKYGWQTPEDAAKEIEELRLLKANPTPAEIKYENEQSEKLAKALQAGKLDEVYNYLDEQRRLDKFLNAEVTDETAEDIIKLNLRLSYKDLTDKEIDFKFNKTYGLPKEPKQGDSELDEVFEERLETWKEQVEEIKTSKIIDAKLAKPTLASAKTNLVVPKIETVEDQGYLQYQKELEESAKLDTETKEAYKAFTSKAIEQKLNFNDEANKIAFEFQYEPTPEEFAKSIEVVVDPEKFWSRYNNSDGSPNRQLFLQDAHFILNREKIIMAAMNQAKNATMKQTLLADNSGGGIGQRQAIQTHEPDELHKMMQAAGVVR